MKQRDRDRLVALKKSRKGLITQRGGGRGDRSKPAAWAPAVKSPKGQKAPRRCYTRCEDWTRKPTKGAGDTTSRCVSRLGPTLAAEYLAGKHDIQAGRETVRTWMMEGKLWRASTPRPKVPQSKATAGRTRKLAVPRAKSSWMKNFHLTSPDKAALAVIATSSPVRTLKPIR